MPVDSKLVGSNERLIQLIGDPAAASQLASVLALGDAVSLAGLYAALRQDVPLLLNVGGTYDRLRAAIGATGILPVQTESIKTTYSVGVTGFTPAATATDFTTLTGSATKTLRLTRVVISGIATTATTIQIQLIK